MRRRTFLAGVLKTIGLSLLPLGPLFRAPNALQLPQLPEAQSSWSNYLGTSSYENKETLLSKLRDAAARTKWKPPTFVSRDGVLGNWDLSE